MNGRRITLVTPNFENNSLGRAWCLWELARELGWSVDVVGVKGTSLWAPMRDTPFAADCHPADDPETALATVRRSADGADLLLAVKPLPTSFGVALDVASHGGPPVLLDIDDPDLEVRTVWRPLAERLRHPMPPARRRALARMAEATASVPVLVSNPALQARYGGTIVPHVRRAGPEPRYSDTTEPVVRFVGSVRAHKGVDVLRRAVARTAAAGVTLEVTAPRPSAVRPWEHWLGTTDIAEGARLVADADVIAVPSLANAWSPAQLPAKLIDAMMAGRAIVASSTPPVAWALGDAGITVPPGSAMALAVAIETLRDPRRRQELGSAARQRAVERFSVEAVAPVFGTAALRALGAPVPTR